MSLYFYNLLHFYLNKRHTSTQAINMNIKRTTLQSFSIITFFSFYFFNPLHAQTNSSAYQTDGKADEWKVENIQTDKDTKLSYAIQNDASGIHILLKGGDLMLQTKLLMGGMQILIDPSGKKSKTIGINYPLPGKFDRAQMRRSFSGGDTTQRRRYSDSSFRNRPDSGRRRQFDVKGMRERTLAQKKELELYGFNDESNGLNDIKESPVKVAIGWDEKDSMVYEITVPYNIFTKAPEAGNKISIGFVLRGMPMPDFGGGGGEGGGERFGGGQRGGDGGGGGMPPGAFMMGGGGSGGGQFDFMKMFEENSFWIKYTLNTF